MANDNFDVKVTYAALQEASTGITSDAGQLYEILNCITSEVEKLKSSWEGIGADTLYTKITTLKPKFDKYNEDLLRYAGFLQETVAEYQSTEQKIVTNANMFN